MLTGAAALVSITGCGALLPKGAPPPILYALDAATSAPIPGAGPSPERSGPGLTLIVSPPQAAPGFESRHIVYVREPQRLESFALSEWVDTPARMLAPLIVAALTPVGAYRAVVSAPSVVSGELRLDTELVRLQHNFGGGPSRVRFTLRATLVDLRSLRVIAWREFDAEQASTSEDVRGGVTAAHQAVHRVLVALSSFCSEATVAQARCGAARVGLPPPGCEPASAPP
jgi:cholesterol transport system auxiliary component